MAHPTITNAIAAGLLEPCSILDGEGREIRGFRPTELGRRYFGPEIDQSEMVDVSNVVPLHSA